MKNCKHLFIKGNNKQKRNKKNKNKYNNLIKENKDKIFKSLKINKQHLLWIIQLTNLWIQLILFARLMKKMLKKRDNIMIKKLNLNAKVNLFK